VLESEKHQLPLSVYRPSLDDAQMPTIGDCRKLYRAMQLDDRSIVTSFLFVINSLERRLRELEARKVPEYRGTWKADESYPEASIITHAGSAWIATIESKGLRPGDGTGWKLMVKHGRDARGGPSVRDKKP
jgi:hypothetical protein